MSAAAHWTSHFKKDPEETCRCIIPISVTDDDNVVQEKECGDSVTVSKDSLWNLKRHVLRKHGGVLKEDVEKKPIGEQFVFFNTYLERVVSDFSGAR